MQWDRLSVCPLTPQPWEQSIATKQTIGYISVQNGTDTHPPGV